MNQPVKGMLYAATMLSSLWAATPALAQEAQGSAGGSSGALMDDIVVTAQKRTQSVQDVGIAITALSGDQITNLGFTSSMDISRMTSNVSLSGSFGGQTQQFNIRGVTQSDLTDHVEAPVAVYIDDGYVALIQGQSFGMFDIERVEVLKGPQGTLFGRNATGGLVHYITRRPTDQFEGFFDATYGSYDNVRLEGAVSGPIAEGLRARLSGYYERYDGYIRNLFPQETFVPPELQPALNKLALPGAGADLGGLKYNFAVRGQVEADVTDNVQVWASFFYNKSRASTGPYQNEPSVAVFDGDGNQIDVLRASPTEICEAIQNGACINGAFDHDANAVRERPGADWFGYLDPDGNGRTTSSDYAFDDVNVARTYGGTGKLTWDFGGVTLTAISDYKKFYKDFSLDLEAGPVNQFFWHSYASAKTFSQEIRLNGESGGLTWVAGGYYLTIDNRTTHGIGALPDSAYPVPAWDQPRIANLKSKSYSLFGQLEYAVTDTVSLIGGLRGSREKKKYHYQVDFVFPTDGGDPFGWDYAPTVPFPGFYQDAYDARTSDTLWSWKAQVNYKPNRDLLLYLGVTQGVKAGSFNAGGPPLPVEQIPYKPEKLISYEAGVKASLIDRRLRFNMSGFYYDYKNYQGARWLGYSSIIINADAYIYGIDTEMTAAVTDNLEASLNIGWQKNKVKDFPIAGGVRDTQIALAPEWTVSALLRYTVPMDVAGGRVAVQVDGNYQSKTWESINNFTNNKLADWAIVNARIDWTLPDDRFKLSFFARNLFDKVYDTLGYDLSQICGCRLTAQGKPRWLGVQARYNF